MSTRWSKTYDDVLQCYPREPDADEWMCAWIHPRTAGRVGHRRRYSSSSTDGGRRQSVTAGRVAGRVDTEAGSPRRADARLSQSPPAGGQPTPLPAYSSPVARHSNHGRRSSEATQPSWNVQPDRWCCCCCCCWTPDSPINRRP